MAKTHNYELNVGDYSFGGEVEISNSGVIAYTEPTNPAMPQKTKDVLRKVLDILGTLPLVYSDLKKFELKIKS